MSQQEQPSERSVRRPWVLKVQAFLQVSTVGALVVLAPVLLLATVATRIKGTLGGLLAPLKGSLPANLEGLFAMLGLTGASLIVVIVGCWLFGTLVLRTTLGSALRSWIERTILSKTPAWTTYQRVAVGSASGDQAAGPRPVLASLQGSWQPAVLVEPAVEGWATVLVPAVPSLQAGQLHYVETCRLKELDVPLAEFKRRLAAVGRGTTVWLDDAGVRDGDPSPDPRSQTDDPIDD